MRLEYTFSLDSVSVPRFSVEAVEGIAKLFSLATLVLNVCEHKERIEIVFHGLNPEDPERKIAGFREIMASSGTAKQPQLTLGKGGRVPNSSSYFQWLVVEGA